MFQTRPEAPRVDPGKTAGTMIKISCRNLSGYERDVAIGLDETVQSLQAQVQQLGLSESLDPRLVLISRFPKLLEPDTPLTALNLSDNRQIIVMEPAPPTPKPRYQDEESEKPLTKEMIAKATEHLPPYMPPDAAANDQRAPRIPLQHSAHMQLYAIMVELRRLATTAQAALRQPDAPQDMETEADVAQDAFAVDEGALQQLLDMGFPEARSRKALYLTQSDVMGALEYLHSHESDPTIDDPLEAPKTEDSGNFKVNPAHFQNLKEMGFGLEIAAAALQLAHNDLDIAIELLFNIGHEEIMSMKERSKQTITKDSAIMKEILSDGRVQATLADPRAITAFDSIIANPQNAAGWLQDPLVGPVLIQISQVLRMSNGED